MWSFFKGRKEILFYRIIIFILVMFILLSDNKIERFVNEQKKISAEEYISSNFNIERSELTSAIISVDIPSVNEIKSQNSVYESVYKDALDKDVVLSFSDRLFIYRSSWPFAGGEVIYNGQSPSRIEEETRKQLISMVENEIISKIDVNFRANTEVPQMIIVDKESVDPLASGNVFYQNVQASDIVIFYYLQSIKAIYRPSTGEIINYSKL